MSDVERIRDLLTPPDGRLTTEDSEASIARYAPGAVLADQAPPLVKDVDLGYYQHWLSTFDAPVELALTELEIQVGGDVAYAHSVNRMRFTKAGVGAHEMWYRATVCLRRIDGDWKITHEHESVPFYMDGSLRAATDLRP